jgi:PKD repeat protein
LSIAGLGSIALLSNSENNPDEVVVQVPAETAPLSPVTSSESTPPQQTDKSESQILSEDRNNPTSDTRTAVSENGYSGENLVEETKSPEPSNTNTRDQNVAEAKEKSDISASNLKSEPIPVKADFTSSQTEGCSPLAVNFINRSENAIQSTWIFGDGGSTIEKDPSYVFDEPGEYSVTLKAIGVDEQVYIAYHVITVFESPKALFEMDENVDLSLMQPVYFYNYSRGAEYYEWDFGDGEQSNLVEPIHYYNQPESYNVKLKVWTQNQCYDSLVIHNAFTGPEGEIQFPNAFTPNMSGPTGGYYEINDISNTIFHPVVKGELIEYQLKIFNRQGLQIFESNDVSTGWDGYFQEKLAGQDVYIWKARDGGG